MSQSLFALTLAAASLICTGQAQTWETVDEHPFPQARASYGSDLACTPDGSVYYLTPVLWESGASWVRYVRRSTDGGATWTTVSGPLDLVYTMAVDRESNLYVAGARSSDGYWTVLKSSDGGKRWTAIFAGNNPSISGVYGVRDLAVDNAGAVYVDGDYQVYVPKRRA